MFGRFVKDFLRDESAAVAATYTLSLIPIVAMAGIAYDFAQMASLDTEVQNAADQAALAAATQLTGSSTAIADATNAASNLLENRTLMANDGKPAALAVTGLTFYVTAANAENDSSPTTNSEDARFVRVDIETRQARFTLTPIVGAIFSNDLGASATAGLGSAMCNVPPVMMCNPVENSDPGFDGPANDDPDYYVGRGVRLVSVTSSTPGAGLSPGNFGYIDVAADDSNQLLALKKALGWNSPDGSCIRQTGIDTKPGANTPVTLALNTRFDIYENGGPGGGACPSGGTCSAAKNATKDLVRNQNSSSCRITPQGWKVSDSPYLPDPVTRQQPAAQPIDAMGHPRDICHAIDHTGGDCPMDFVGDGIWDRQAYWAVNYPSLAQPPGYSTMTRYGLYRWELDNWGLVSAARALTGGGNPPTDHNAPVCDASGGIDPNDVPPGIDRRTFPVALVNCLAEEVKGKSEGVNVIKWLNVFLVEPSLNRQRTQNQDVYVEIVSVNELGNNDGGQVAVIRRDKPYLLK